MELNKIYQGDCLELGHEIEPGSVDLILTDLPYGNMNTDGGRRLGINGWDMPIEPKEVYAIANRILRKNGKIILFSQEPYTTRLITETFPNLPFNYRAIWEKDSFANALGVNRNMVSFYEDILVFSKTHDTEGLHPLREYAQKVREYTNYSRSRFYRELGHGGAQHFLESNKESSQFALCTEATYDALITEYGIDRMDDFISYEELVEIDRKTKDEHFPSVFNLWEENKYKSNILKYRKDYDGYHPTQKPVALLKDLIKTFSNEGDLVVDLTCGSGSTCVAAQKTGRSFIGIEKEKEYVDIANERIRNHTTQTDIFNLLEGE